MSKQKFFLVSLPTSISPSNDRDEALTALRSAITTDNGITYKFDIPTFKIGTLDALVQQADDLAKLEQSCEGVVAKVADSLRSILEGDEEKIAEQKNVNDSTTSFPNQIQRISADHKQQSRWTAIFRHLAGTRSNIAPTSPSRSL